MNLSILIIHITTKNWSLFDLTRENVASGVEMPRLYFKCCQQHGPTEKCQRFDIVKGITLSIRLQHSKFLKTVCQFCFLVEDWLLLLLVYTIYRFIDQALFFPNTLFILSLHSQSFDLLFLRVYYYYYYYLPLFENNRHWDFFYYYYFSQ